MVQLPTSSDTPISSYEQKTMQTLTPDISAHEGRTGVNPLTFLIGRYLWDPNTRLKIAKKLKKIQLSLPKVTKVKLGSRIRRPRGFKQFNSHLKLTFRSRVIKKNAIIDPNLTSDHMAVLFENVPLPHSHLVLKLQLCWNFPLGVIAPWLKLVFAPYLTLHDLYQHQKQ